MNKSALSLNVREADGPRRVVALTGAMDWHTATQLREEGVRLLADSPHLVLDVSAVTFCDSSGLSVLVQLRRRAVGAGGSVVLTRVPGHLLRLLEISGLGPVFLGDGAGHPPEQDGPHGSR
ncbi:STAS domain-containing protein [Streptomyces sp. NBC_00539]|uniref:STAS domain-containing protein n=1 Tax=Streptomyces sp. NBC_00539 TaxID=2975770 RepID=UPI002E812A72|nr:STAS domain-containing protein [Streptomyces sp. NBC_00539]WUC63263.1 STAS domain-containing protein [Streptomyces sp. NBC_00539]